MVTDTVTIANFYVPFLRVRYGAAHACVPQRCPRFPALASVILPQAQRGAGCRFLGFPRAARPPREPTAARSPLAARRRPRATAAGFLGIGILTALLNVRRISRFSPLPIFCFCLVRFHLRGPTGITGAGSGEELTGPCPASSGILARDFIGIGAEFHSQRSS